MRGLDLMPLKRARVALATLISILLVGGVWAGTYTVDLMLTRSVGFERAVPYGILATGLLFLVVALIFIFREDVAGER